MKLLIDLLFPGMSPETALGLSAGLSAFITVMALARTFVPHDPLGLRVKAHAKRRAELRTEAIASPRRSRQTHVSVLRSLLDRLKLTQGEESRSSAEDWPGQS